ncbi:hypothetical protein R3P38DRAFT_3179200 [Favolaschia claudopus]|uniref:Uncharacterized protein n=1 Tax=Favolaschia claudopus TaxID=2862362 RepID=A0AAW0CRY3_9AGAR
MNGEQPPSDASPSLLSQTLRQKADFERKQHSIDECRSVIEENGYQHRADLEVYIDEGKKASQDTAGGRGYHAKQSLLDAVNAYVDCLVDIGGSSGPDNVITCPTYCNVGVGVARIRMPSRFVSRKPPARTPSIPSHERHWHTTQMHICPPIRNTTQLDHPSSSTRRKSSIWRDVAGRGLGNHEIMSPRRTTRTVTSSTSMPCRYQAIIARYQHPSYSLERVCGPRRQLSHVVSCIHAVGGELSSPQNHPAKALSDTKTTDLNLRTAAMSCEPRPTPATIATQPSPRLYLLPTNLAPSPNAGIVRLERQSLNVARDGGTTPSRMPPHAIVIVDVDASSKFRTHEPPPRRQAHHIASYRERSKPDNLGVGRSCRITSAQMHLHHGGD